MEFDITETDMTEFDITLFDITLILMLKSDHSNKAGS